MDPTGGAARAPRTFHANGPSFDPAPALPRVPADIFGNGEIIEGIKREAARTRAYGDALRDGMWQT